VILGVTAVDGEGGLYCLDQREADGKAALLAQARSGQTEVIVVAHDAKLGSPGTHRFGSLAEADPQAVCVVTNQPQSPPVRERVAALEQSLPLPLEQV